MRLIDADALINTLGVSDEDIAFIDALRDAPSIDIVRCKECKWYNADEYSGIYRCYRGLTDVTADDFCSCGEKQTERGE